MINRDDLKSQTGEISENFLFHYLQEHGFKVERSADKFDQLHDIFVNGIGYQIKCQMPWIFRQAITFTWDNFDKYRQNNVPIIVLTTRRKHDISTHYLGGKILAVSPKSAEFTVETSEYSELPEKKAVLKIERNPGIYIFKDRIPDDILDQLEETSVSRLGL